MQTSKKGLDLIKEFEGFEAHAYDLGDGGWTIGYGSFNVPGVDEQTVWTKADALKQLAIDVQQFEDAINRIDATLTQNQFDALVSFTYNLGPSWITDYPAMPSALRQQDWTYMTESMLNFIMPGTKFERGLLRRRKAEVKLFNRV